MLCMYQYKIDFVIYVFSAPDGMVYLCFNIYTGHTNMKYTAIVQITYYALCVLHVQCYHATHSLVSLSSFNVASNVSVKLFL